MTCSLEPSERGFVAETLVSSCIGRRDSWPSLSAIEEDLLRSPFFRAWDERVFRSFLQSGLCPLVRFPTYAGDQDEGKVGLITPRWAEATVFAGGLGMLVGYDKLSELREDMKVTFIMAEDPSSYVSSGWSIVLVVPTEFSADHGGVWRFDRTGGVERTHDIVWRPPRAENVIVKGASHLVRPISRDFRIYRQLNLNPSDRSCKRNPSRLPRPCMPV
jgi:hypothetical protein